MIKRAYMWLKPYSKEWDDLHGAWKDRPRHDDASHGADAFMTFACSGIDYQERLTDRFEEEEDDRPWREVNSGRNPTTGY